MNKKLIFQLIFITNDNIYFFLLLYHKTKEFKKYHLNINIY